MGRLCSRFSRFRMTHFERFFFINIFEKDSIMEMNEKKCLCFFVRVCKQPMEKKTHTNSMPFQSEIG